MNAIDELSDRLQVDWGRPTLDLYCSAYPVADGDDVGALVESTNVLNLLEAEELEEVDDSGLEGQSV